MDQGLASLFTDASPEALEHASRRFLQMERPPGDVIVEEGEVHDAMFFLESGSVTVTVGGFDVAELEAGACVGEIALFTTAVRTASVTAKTDVVLHVLSRPAFDALRTEAPSVAASIERRAIGQLGARLRKVVADIRIVGNEAHALLTDLPQSRQHDGAPVPLPPSAILACLERSTPFQGAVAGALDAIAEHAGMRVYPAGATVASVGLRDGPLQMLVAGRVDCLVQLEADAIRAATLEGGELFNLLQHVDRQPRPMSYVTSEPTTVLTLGRRETRHLLDSAGPVASALRTAMIRSLADRVNQANAIYSMAKLTRLEVATGAPAPGRVVAESPNRQVRGVEIQAPPGSAHAAPLVAPPEARTVPRPDRSTDQPDTPGSGMPAPPPTGFDPREYVEPAPLALGQPLDDGGWFDEEGDWDTWFDLTDEVSLQSNEGP